MKPVFIFIFWAFGAINLVGQNQVPVISNVQVAVNWIAKTMVVQYDVIDTENDMVTIVVEISDNGGLSYSLTTSAQFSGDIGGGITPGTGKSVNVDLSGITPVPGGAYRVRLTATDGQPFDLQALVNEVDSNRLRSDLEYVQGVRHRTGGLAHLNSVRDSIENSFIHAGLATTQQTWAFGNYTGRNIIGSQRGLNTPNNVVVVDAHYDTVSNAPGADDNGSGTVGVLEIARLLSRYPTQKTARYIGFDLEESGLLGSIRYVQNGIPAGESIEGVLNFEMIGYYSEAPNSQTLPAGFNLLFPDAYNQVINNQSRGDFITNVGNTFSNDLVNLFNSSAATYVPELKIIPVVVPGNGEIAPDLRRSDHAPFWSGGYKALMLTDGANFRNECYHTPQDTLDNKLNFTFMSRAVKATLATMAALVEPMHGSMVIANIDSPSSVTEVQACRPKIEVWGNRINVYRNDCDWVNPHFYLYDISGKLIWDIEKEGRGAQVYWFDELPASTGIYFFKMDTGNGSITEKIVLNR